MTGKNTIIKIVKKMINNPAEMKFNDITRVFNYFGYKHDNTRGSHFIYIKGTDLLTVVHHKKRVKKVYIKKIVEHLNLEEWYENEKKH